MPSAGDLQCWVGGWLQGAGRGSWRACPEIPRPPPCLVWMQFTEEVEEPPVCYQEASLERSSVKGSL